MESIDTFTGLVRRAADQSPSDRVGLGRDFDPTSKELFWIVERTAARLVAIGLKPGDVVALSCPLKFSDHVAEVIICLAVIRTRAAVLPVDSLNIGEVEKSFLYKPVKLFITTNEGSTLAKAVATEFDIPHLSATFTSADSEITFTAASKSEVDTDLLAELINYPSDIAFCTVADNITQHDLYSAVQFAKFGSEVTDSESIFTACLSKFVFRNPISALAPPCFPILSTDDGAPKGNPFRQKMYILDESSVLQGLNPNGTPLICGNGVTKFNVFNGINSSVVNKFRGSGASMPEELQPEELSAIRHNKENASSVVLIHAGSMQGSGVIWDTKGHIVTNYHVIGNAPDIRVTLADKRTYIAEKAGVDASNDIALLRIINPPKEKKLTPVKIGVSAGLQVCQKVYAIGHPFGLGQSTTSGIISSLERPPCWDTDLIQHDAPINTGNSGGALLNSSGKLIGINTYIQTGCGSSCGVGFAIPVDTVSYIVDKLLTSKTVAEPPLEIIVVPSNQPVKCGEPTLGIKVTPDQSVVKLGAIAIIVLDASANGPAGKLGHRRAKHGRLDLDNIIKSVVSLIGAELGDEVATQVVYPDLLGEIPVLNHDSKKSKKRYLSSLDTSHHILGRCCEGYAFHNLAVGPITA